MGSLIPISLPLLQFSQPSKREIHGRGHHNGTQEIANIDRRETWLKTLPSILITPEARILISSVVNHKHRRNSFGDTQSDDHKYLWRTLLKSAYQ